MHPLSPTSNASTIGTSPRELHEEGRPGGGPSPATPGAAGGRKNVEPRHESAPSCDKSAERRPSTRRSAAGATPAPDCMPRGTQLKSKVARKAAPPASPPVESTEPQPLNDVLGAIVHHRTVAIICEHLVEHTADTFRGNDACGPRKMLLMPNGTRCRAEIEHVLKVEAVLRQLAFDSRMKVNKLLAAGVLVERAAVAQADVAHGPFPPPPPGEGVVECAPVQRGAPSVSARSRQSPAGS